MSFVLLIAAAVSAPAAPAVLLDDPTPQQRARIERALRQQGYVGWDDIEFDDGVWEVDDALTRRGGEYDLKLDPRTLRVISREGDRPANAREIARIAPVLRQMGYVRWDSIKYDTDGYWDVDDARMPDGTEHDLKLHPRTLRVLERD